MHSSSNVLWVMSKACGRSIEAYQGMVLSLYRPRTPIAERWNIDDWGSLYREKIKIEDFNCRFDGVPPYTELLRGSTCTVMSPGVGTGRGAPRNKNWMKPRMKLGDWEWIQSDSCIVTEKFGDLVGVWPVLGELEFGSVLLWTRIRLIYFV